jgi:UDP-N-acetylglucosamine 2-epimerase (non-hydrolysing)
MKLLIVFGTRPELIKLAPIITLANDSSDTQLHVCFTGQHPDLVIPLASALNIMIHTQLSLKDTHGDLSLLSAQVIENLKPIMLNEQPDFCVVQGDTTSTLCGALSAFYHEIPVVHVEAGLRSGSIREPFPEEINRRLIAQLATVHFAPTEHDANNLYQSGISKHIVTVGNTVVDAVRQIQNTYSGDARLPSLSPDKQTIVVTCHRRENWGSGMRRLCDELKMLVCTQPVQIVFVCHANPTLQAKAHEFLGEHSSIFIMPPILYPQFIQLMQASDIIITDSGGIQEEAPILGKPVLVFRNTTERIQGIQSGQAHCVSSGTLSQMVVKLLNNSDQYRIMAQEKSVYGDGNAAQRILKYLGGIINESNPDF